MAVGRSLARSLGSLGDLLRTAVRQTGLLDTNPVPPEWTHVTKVDPEPAKRLPVLYPLYLQHTDAVAVGGSDSVDAGTTEATFELLTSAPVPAFHEPSSATHVTNTTLREAAFLAVPEVLNGGSDALVGTLGAGLEHVRDSLAPEAIAESVPFPVPDPLADRLAEFATSWLLHEAVFEAYIVQNPDSAAAREAAVAGEDVLSAEQARQRAMAAERHLESEILYVEYSGTYGGPQAVDVVDAVSGATEWSRVWYGGGLTSAAQVGAVRDAGADTVVVGDVFHRIADDERELFGRARDALGPDANGPAVAAWVTETVDMGDSAACQYLSTVPTLADPAAAARRYLTASLQVWFRLHAAVASDDETAAPPVDGLRRADFGRLSVEALGEHVRRIFDAAAEPTTSPLPLSHLSVDLDDHT